MRRTGCTRTLKDANRALLQRLCEPPYPDSFHCLERVLLERPPLSGHKPLAVGLSQQSCGLFNQACLYVIAWKLGRVRLTGQSSIT